MAYPLRRTLRLEAPGSWQMLNLAELWAYRELLFFFVWRDVKVRYKQTVLGAAWAVIQPLTTTFVFTILFGRFGGMSKQVEGPYALHVFVGMLPWTFFANAVAAAANSLIGSSHLISKVYFPRILIPIAAIAARARRLRDLVRRPARDDGRVRRGADVGDALRSRCICWARSSAPPAPASCSPRSSSPTATCAMS